MAWVHALINNRKVVEHMQDDLDSLQSRLRQYLSTVEGLDNVEDLKVMSHVIYSDIARYSKSWDEYLKTYKLSYEQDFEKLKELSDNTIARLNEQQIRLDEEINLAHKKIEDLTEQIAMLEAENSSLKIEIGSLRENNRGISVIDYINQKANILANQEAFMIRQTKQHPSGKKHVKYKQDVDTDALVADYKAANNVLNKRIVEKYGMTYQGLKVRLVEAGVWVGNNNEGGNL